MHAHESDMNQLYVHKQKDLLQINNKIEDVYLKYVNGEIDVSNYVDSIKRLKKNKETVTSKLKELPFQYPKGF